MAPPACRSCWTSSPPGEENAQQHTDGTLHLADETAAANTGVRLRPFPIRSGKLIDADADQTTLERVQLVYRSGTRADVRVRHAGPVGFLAAKADALARRDEAKDGYDVSWWSINAKPTPAEVAELVTRRPAFTDDLFPESVAQLQAAYRAPDYPGPDGYAREKHPGLQPGDAEYDQSCNTAYLTVTQIIEILKRSLW